MQNQTNHPGQLIDAEAPVGGYTAGALVAIGGILAIAKDTYAEGERAALSTAGEFGLTAVVPGEAWAEGERLFYNETTGLVTNDETHWPIGQAGEAKAAQAAGAGFGVVQLDGPQRQTEEVLYAVRFGATFTPTAGVQGDFTLRDFGGDAWIPSCAVASDSLVGVGATVSLGDGTGANDQVLEAQTIVAIDGYNEVDDLNGLAKLPVKIDKLVMRIAVADITDGVLVVRGRFVRGA